MADAGVDGARDLEVLASRLKGADRQIRKEMLASFRKVGKPIIADVRSVARSTLPSGGGLAALVAGSAYGVRTKLTGDVGVRIQGTGRTVRGLRTIDNGLVRHPVFGNRSAWAVQPVTAGYFTKTVQRNLPTIRDGISDAMERTAQQITEGI